MTETPEPLTPPDCDLRDYAWMPLDVVRLRDSDMAGTPNAEAFRCAVLLWCAAWHQVPAASLPDDENSLARLAGYGRDVKTFRLAREQGAMRGWIKCSDGRWYHAVVAEKAKEAAAQKAAMKARTEAARRAKAGKVASVTTDPNTPPQPTVTKPAADNVTTFPTKPAAEAVAVSVTEPVTSSTRPDQTRPDQTVPDQKKEKEDRSLRSLPRLKGAEGAFDDFWAGYPRKVGKDAARKAFAAAVRRASIFDIAAGLARQRWPDNPQFIPHPATWLNQGRWGDDPLAAAPPLVPATTAAERRKAADDEKMRGFLKRAEARGTGETQPELNPGGLLQ